MQLCEVIPLEKKEEEEKKKQGRKITLSTAVARVI